MNGDSRDDVLHRADTQASSVALSLPEATPADALGSVTSELGSVATIAYTPSSVWDNTLLPFVVYTVSGASW